MAVRWKWIFSRFSFVLSGVLFAALAVELAFRLYLILFRPLIPPYANSTEFPPHARGDYRGGTVTTDRYGFRNDDSIWDARKRGMIIGDSVCFGMGLDDTDSPASQINRISKSSDINIVNLCHPGWDTQALRNRLFEFGERTAPWELIIWHYYINDAKLSTEYVPFSSALVERDQWVPFSASLSYLFLRYVNLLNEKALKEDPRRSSGESYYRWCIESFTPGSQTAKNESLYLRDVIFWSKQRDIPFYLVVSPSKQQYNDNNRLPQEFIRTIADQTETPVINLLPLTSPDIFLDGDSAHYSPSGSRRVAEILYEEIITKHNNNGHLSQQAGQMP